MLYPLVVADTGFVACLYGDRPVVFVARHLTVTERKYGLLTRLVTLVVWALRRLRRYTTFARDIQVFMPTQADTIEVADPATYMRLRAQIVDM